MVRAGVLTSLRILLAMAVVIAGARSASPQDAAPPPRILLDQPLRAVEYQLSRLTNAELVSVERRVDDPRFRPVYVAVLTRKGIARPYRDEALAALVKMDGTNAVRILIDALARVPNDDVATVDALARMLVAVPVPELSQNRAVVEAAMVQPQTAAAAAAFAAALVAGPGVEGVWPFASARDLLPVLFRALPVVPRDEMATMGPALSTRIIALLGQTPAPALRADALAALGWTTRDRAAFDLLAGEVMTGSDDASRAAALRSLQLLPPEVWSPATIEPLARAIITDVGKRPIATRTEPASVDAIHFGERLAAALPDERGRALRRDLAALGVRVVRLEVVPDNLAFTTKYFVVEAAKLVEVVLANTDTMPHNVVIGRPGSVQEIGLAGDAMSMPSDPNVKPFVPDSPLVLFATPLIQPGETGRLTFTAPTAPGEYVYLCTFPRHWIRMYGVMLVVPSLEAWEANRVLPTDPLTREQLK